MKVIYCSVVFSPYQKRYYYKSTDENIITGDLVVVPVGENDHEQMGVVKKVELFDVDNVPFPLSKTKVIIRKERIEDYPDFQIDRDIILNDFIENEDEPKNDYETQIHDFLLTKYLVLCDIRRKDV